MLLEETEIVRMMRLTTCVLSAHLQTEEQMVELEVWIAESSLNWFLKDMWTCLEQTIILNCVKFPLPQGKASLNLTKDPQHMFSTKLHTQDVTKWCMVDQMVMSSMHCQRVVPIPGKPKYHAKLRSVRWKRSYKMDYCVKKWAFAQAISLKRIKNSAMSLCHFPHKIVIGKVMKSHLPSPGFEPTTLLMQSTGCGISHFDLLKMCFLHCANYGAQRANSIL